MRICFMGQGTALKTQKNERADLFLVGGMDEVSYEKELQGETKFFEEATLFSKKMQSVVVKGCITDTHGHKRKSALVAENGRLLGVSDGLYAMDDKIGAGAALHVYETKVGRMGVLVGEDLSFPETVRSLVDCGSDFVVCIYEKAEGELPAVLIRADAYFFGVPILFCGNGRGMVATTDGNMSIDTEQAPFYTDFEYAPQYQLVRVRKKGNFKNVE